MYYYLRRFGLIKALGFGIYDGEFFAGQVDLTEAYRELADVIYSSFRPGSVCDFGCGNAFLIHFLKSSGVNVKGVEGSQHAFTYIPENVRNHVIISTVTKPLSLGRFDLVICTEVAEHIPKKMSTCLIENLVKHAKSGIFFTAAQPGQWGDGHINCQPRGYWENMFCGHGWRVNKALEARILEGIRAKRRINKQLPWAPKNMIALVPDPPHHEK